MAGAFEQQATIQPPLRSVRSQRHPRRRKIYAGIPCVCWRYRIRPMNRIPRLLPQISLVILLAACLWATVYGLRHLRKYQPFADIIGQQHQIGSLGLDVHSAEVAGRSHGRLVWRLKARHIAFTEDGHAVSVDSVTNGRLFNAAGKPAVTLSAGHVDFSSPMGMEQAADYGVLSLSGGIKAKVLGRNGPTFSCDRVTWNGMTAIADAPGQVVISFPNGSGTAIATDLRYYTKTHDVSISRLHGTFRASQLVK